MITISELPSSAVGSPEQDIAAVRAAHAAEIADLKSKHSDEIADLVRDKDDEIEALKKVGIVFVGSRCCGDMNEVGKYCSRVMMSECLILRSCLCGVPFEDVSSHLSRHCCNTERTMVAKII